MLLWIMGFYSSSHIPKEKNVFKYVGQGSSINYVRIKCENVMFVKSGHLALSLTYYVNQVSYPE